MIAIIIFNILSLILFVIYACITQKTIKGYENREKRTINMIRVLIASIGTQKSYIERNHLKSILESFLDDLEKGK